MVAIKKKGQAGRKKRGKTGDEKDKNGDEMFPQNVGEMMVWRKDKIEDTRMVRKTGSEDKIAIAK